MSSADTIHPFSSDFAHPYYVAPGSFRERPKSIIVRGASWASFRRRGWRLFRLVGGLRMGSAGRPWRRLSEELGVGVGRLGLYMRGVGVSGGVKKKI